VRMQPLQVRVESTVSSRSLLEALWREALWLVNDGVATTAEIDDAIRYGAGLRWSFMGTFLTYRLAGGEAGCGTFWRSSARAETALDQAGRLRTDRRPDRSRRRAIDEQAAGSACANTSRNATIAWST